MLETSIGCTSTFKGIRTLENINAITIPEEIKQEFSVEADGKTYASHRATARLCNVSHSAINKLIKKIGGNLRVPKSLESFAKQDFEGGNLPDILVAKIIEYYAFDADRYCTEQAKLLFRTFSIIGIRTWIQQELNWQAPQQPRSIDEGRIEKLEQSQKDFLDTVALSVRTSVESKQIALEAQYRAESLRDDLSEYRRELRQLQQEHDRFIYKYEKLLEEHSALIEQREYRAKINAMMKQACKDNDGYRKAYWNGLYGELIAQTGFEVYAAAKLWHCSCLDAVEIQGLMPKLYHIASEFILRRN